MEKLRQEHHLPYLTLDGGNLLFKQERLSPGLLLQAKITAEGIVNSYTAMHYDAVAVGIHDLAAGLAFLQDQAINSKFAWLSANLVRKSDKTAVFHATLVRKVGSLTVGVIGLTGFDGPVRFTEKDDALLLPWQEVLPDIVADLKARCDLLILLSNFMPVQNDAIAAAFPDINIIIQSAPRSGNIAPELHNKTLITQTGKQGKYLGWMSVNWQKSRTWGREGITKELATKKQELDGVNGRISRSERLKQKEDLTANTSYQNLLATRERLLSEIIFLENEVLSQQESGQAPATFESHFITIDINLPDQPEVKKIVETTKLRVNQSGRSQAGESSTAPGVAELKLENLAFTGWMACALCHKPQTVFWRKTGHASAYQTLIREEQQFNLDCLPCHVTAEYKEIKINDNDTVLLSLPEQLQQVGCEVCHGPGRKHAATQDPADISRKPDVSICTRCHTPERDEKFNYDNAVERIACPANP